MLNIILPLTNAPTAEATPPAYPWYLDDTSGRPLIETVVRSLTPSDRHQFVFVVLADDLRRWALDDMFRLIAPGCRIVTAQHTTAGELCAALLALEESVRSTQILVATAERDANIPVANFLAQARKPGVDGCIATFPSTHPRWNTVREEGGEVVEVAIQRPISNQAATGRYWFRDHKDLLEAAERYLLKNLGTLSTFELGPVYNELILMGRKITAHNSSLQGSDRSPSPAEPKTHSEAHPSVQPGTVGAR